MPMLREIYIRNFILIEELRIDFQSGLNVLTGETGAGKSILIDALGCITGDRIKADFIRDLDKKTIIEAVFSIENNNEAKAFLKDNSLIDDEEDIVIITREFSSGGRSVARINGRNTPVATIRMLAGYLVDMHLQHDQLSLLRPDMYLKYIDGFGDTHQLRLSISDIYNRLERIQKRITIIQDQEKDREDKIDLLKYQIEEIKKANIKPGEEEELISTRNRVLNAQLLAEGTATLLNLLYSGITSKSAYDLISEALSIAQKLKGDEAFDSVIHALEEVSYTIEDVASTLAAFKESLDFEPGVLNDLEERLYILGRIKKKYGNDLSEVLMYLDNASKQLEALENMRTEMEALEAEAAKLKTEYFNYASQLTRIRYEAARELEKKVNAELNQMEMPHITFSVKISKLDKPGPYGLEQVDFLFSPNPGEGLRPLSQTASGGEISRFVLAIKKALADVYQVPTLILDEIDTGVGGTALTAMAKKLAELSHNHQVILVTHAPQIGSYADVHYLVQKEVQGSRTVVKVLALDYDNRVQEIARMMGGKDYSEITLQHAMEMLARASK
jgi:DNA repair protein RecN (Recombination protein N)